MAFNKFIILLLALSSLLSFYAEAQSVSVGEAVYQPSPSVAVGEAVYRHESDDDPLLRQICRGCQYPADCVHFLAPELTGKEMNSQTALQAGLKVLSAELQKAIDQAHNTLSQTQSNEVKQIVQQYLKIYQEMVQVNERTKSVFATKQFGSVESDLVKVESTMTESRDTLIEKKKTFPELEKLDEINGNVYVIARNNVGIALDINKPQYDD